MTIPNNKNNRMLITMSISHIKRDKLNPYNVNSKIGESHNPWTNDSEVNNSKESSLSAKKEENRAKLWKNRKK